jgi:hypothetical protein
MSDPFASALTAAMRDVSAATADCPELFARVATGARRRQRRQRAGIAVIGLVVAAAAVAIPAVVSDAAPRHSTVSASATSQPDLQVCAPTVGPGHLTDTGSETTSLDGPLQSMRHYWGVRIESSSACVFEPDPQSPL